MSKYHIKLENNQTDEQYDFNTDKFIILYECEDYKEWCYQSGGDIKGVSELVEKLKKDL